MQTARTHTRSLLAAGLFLGVGIAAWWLLTPSIAQARQDRPRHPLHAALEEAREAKREMERAGHDFGGNKEEALKSTEHAIKHLERMLGWVREHKKEELKQEFKDEKRAEVKGEKYPRLHAAVHELRKAHKYVEQSKHEFGDSKQKEEALRSLRHAVEHLEKALKFAENK